MQTLEDYISDNFGTKANFARAQGVFPQQVTTWQRKGYMVENHTLLKPMKEFNKPTTTND